MVVVENLTVEVFFGLSCVNFHGVTGLGRKEI